MTVAAVARDGRKWRRKAAYLGFSAATALLGFSAVLYAGPGAVTESGSASDDWAYYNGNPGATHYSRLADINTRNVHELKVAWTYDTGDANAAGNGFIPADMQSNPLVINGRLFFISPKGRLIALDAATGKELWTFDPAEGRGVYSRQRLRGVSYWTDGALRRILFTFRGKLLSVDADSGRPDPEFGSGGRVDLREGMGRDPDSVSVTNVSPGAVFQDLIVFGGTGNSPGHIRAFDVRSGKLRWVFHTIPQPGEPGYETWPKDAWKTAMGANSWAGFALDSKRGLIFVPTASGGMGDKDFYGADRHGDNLFASSLVALDAKTGKRVWHFQTVRHDMWDRDLPTAPTLVTVKRNGKRIDAVAQITKSGLIYVLDRETGKSLFPLEERAALPSDVPGEKAASSQVFPLLPAPFARQHLTADILTRRTPEAHEAVQRAFAKLRSRGPFDPPSLQGTIIFPGLDGGGEWGGAAFDPETGLLYVNANEMAWILKLGKRPPTVTGANIDGRTVYRNNCASCHGEDLKGTPPEFPSLVGVKDRLPPLDMFLQIAFGGGRMPAFKQLGTDQLRAVIQYVSGGKALALGDASSQPVSKPGIAPPLADYVFEGYTKFLDPDGYPAVAPPWGTLSAINLNTGRYAWKIPFGEYPELAAKGMAGTGSENYGGSVVTAGGLLFIGATVYDNKFHAFDKRSGKLLWETTLPAAGNATPATYRANGRQFVVIAAGGGKNSKEKQGGKIIAFALPQ